MEYHLPEDRMAEAEVSLRLAFCLLRLQERKRTVSVAIDGAQIRVHGAQVFPIQRFLQKHGWKLAQQKGKNLWQGRYERGAQQLWIHSRSGEGDVVTWIRDKRVRAECKGGPLIKKPGSREYPKLRQALRQILTVERVESQDELMVAVPLSAKFRQLADQWRTAPLVEKCGMGILMVGRDGTVEGLDLEWAIDLTRAGRVRVTVEALNVTVRFSNGEALRFRWPPATRGVEWLAEDLHTLNKAPGSLVSARAQARNGWWQEAKCIGRSL